MGGKRLRGMEILKTPPGPPPPGGGETGGLTPRGALARGGALQAAGLKKGDRVATLMWNHYAHLETYFAVPCAGGVLHTLNLRLHPDDIGYIANHAGDRFLMVDDVRLPLY